jgi:hypothetical protein
MRRWNGFRRRRLSNLPMTSNTSLRAAVLSAALTIEPPRIDALELRLPPIREVMPRASTPLDLDAPIFRYHIDLDGNVSTVRDAIGARSCNRSHRGLRI